MWITFFRGLLPMMYLASGQFGNNFAEINGIGIWSLFITDHTAKSDKNISFIAKALIAKIYFAALRI